MQQSQFVVYEDASGGWRWRHIADNGRIIADSSESYVSKYNAERARDRAIELTAELWAHEDVTRRHSSESLEEEI